MDIKTVDVKIKEWLDKKNRRIIMSLKNILKNIKSKREVKRILKYCKKGNIEDLTNNDWWFTSYDPKLSRGFIRKHKNKLQSFGISRCAKLNENFIIENIKYIDIDGLKLNKTINKKLYNKIEKKYFALVIKEKKRKKIWNNIFKKRLSEEFIKKFKNKVNWEYINKKRSRIC